MPGKHTAKQKRMANHIKASYIKRGVSPERAERYGWMTVNKNKGKKKRRK
jgi:hypothetical protein